MTKTEQLDNLVKENNGIIQTSQVIEAGISKPFFYEYARANNLKQTAHGVYVSEDTWVDSMFLLHLRCPQAVYSHETALFFHDLTDREPSPYSVTVKRGYSPTRLKADGVMAYTIKEDLYSLGISSAKTPYGHEVPVYDMERTICDLIRNRNNTESQTLNDALKKYVANKEKNLRKLMQYASKLRVEKVLRQYLEVLL